MCDVPQEKNEELSTAEWKKVISDASRLGAQTVVFSGGEPLLREDIFELISFTKKNSLNACVTSNGYLIDEQVAGKLSESKVNVVNISIEGTKETHDFLRGAGSFDKAVAALENLRKYKIEATVAATVSKYNYSNLPYVLEVAKNYGATTVRLQPFNIIFLKDHTRQSEFLVGKRDIQRIENMVKKFIDISKEYKIAVNPESYLLKIPAYLTGKKFYPDNCGALWYSCPINSKGDVFPCWIEASNKLIGNLKEESLYGVWLSEKRMKTINSLIDNGCRGCLMSCYDEVFTRKFFKKNIFNIFKKIKKLANYQKVINKVKQSLKSQIIRLRLRCRFYASYKGSLAVLLRRRLLGIFNKARPSGKNNQKEREAILSEINQAKNKLKKEINSL